MKKSLLLFVFVCCSIWVHATHIAGGELFYERIGAGSTANSDLYRITMRLFRQCTSTGGTGAALTIETPRIAIYNTEGLTLVTSVTLTAQFTTVPTLQNNPAANPCLTGTDNIACYEIGTWSGQIELPRTNSGYTIVWTRYTRRNASNVGIGGNTGATFVTTIPGQNVIPNGFNNSAQFVIKDTTVICRGANFSVNFSATDPDNDSLSFRFGDPYDGVSGSSGNPDPFVQNGPPGNVSFTNIPYLTPYSTQFPLGSGATINNQTGIISGIAPTTAGYYVLVVIAEEWRNGLKLNEHRKDFTIKVGDCTLAGASLSDSTLCRNNTITLQNLSGSSGITGYLWNFGDPGSGINNTSTSPVASHTFSDSGKFVVKLIVTNTQGCQDSAKATISVYPLFKSDFSFTGNCFQSPFQFNDISTATYGVPTAWHWDFGEIALSDDTSNIKNPTYKYNSAGTRTVSLVAYSSKGCVDSISKPVLVRANPVLNLPFKDTLICSIDQLPLIAQGTGSFTWTSVPNDPLFITRTIPNPIVTPKDTTLYIVTLNDNGCIKTDTITVNVLDFITVNLGLDTNMCKTDTIIMKTVSHALSYQWSPATGLSSTTTKFPKVFPDTTTTYYVKANLGLCPAFDTITIFVAPYPQADAGSPKTICYGDKVQLSANYVGTGYAWSPTNTLQNPTSLTPFAGPMQTTAYIFTAFSQGICPKPKSDTVVVTVRPKVNVFAGNDTIVFATQPLQLNATGATTYAWSPSFGLSATTIANPVATLPATVDSIIYRVRGFDNAGCFGDDDMKVIVFKTGPDIFVPTAFTPNNDGRNDIERPVLVGMQQLVSFRIYNRWGQMVYSTSEVGKGWDGTLGGKPQPSGTYVFFAEAIDYKGDRVTKKGTVVLIR